MTNQTVLAVDVGTRSARAGVFSSSGALLGRAEHPILVHSPQSDHAEHDSEDIWQAVGIATREARERAGVAAEDVVGLSGRSS